MDPVSRSPAPDAWRDQYAGGLAPDPEVEAALNGAPMSETVAFRPAPPATPTYLGTSFGPMQRLR